MAHKVTIDVEARFIDNFTDDAKASSKSLEQVEKSAEEAKKEIKDLGKTKAKPRIDVDNNDAMRKVDKIDKKLNKIDRSKKNIVLNAMDKASRVIDKIRSKVNGFKGKTYSILMKIRDSQALSSIRNISNGIKGVTGKTWSTLVKIKDYATAPLSKLKNTLFSIKSLVMAITAGLAAKQLVLKPINLADAYSSAQIGFKTLLGDSRGQQMMDDLDVFAKATPFKSSEVIAQSQKMLAMGWNVDDIIGDMKTIGDAAAATGKGDEGLQRIVLALSQIKSKGKLSTEELNQLAEAGISAKRYLAEGLGYGTGDEGLMAMTKDLEKGAIGADTAVKALLNGMKEYQGMMDRTANETVEGLWSQIEDTFEINVFRKWGQGLQDGAKKTFGSIVTLIDEAEGSLEKFGDVIYEVGKSISNWLSTKFEKAIERITEITGSYEFNKASLGGKVSMLWKGVIVDPLKEWWENGGQDKTAKTAGKIGAWIGETLTKGLLAIFGATDVLDDKVGEDAGKSVAGSFMQGFLDNFDGSAVTQAFVDAIGNVWNALPAWGKFLVGGYVGGKAISGIGNVVGGIANIAQFAGSVIGKTGVYGAYGSGILGGLSKLGYGAASLVGGTKGTAALLGVGGGTAALAGGGALITGAGLVKSGIDFYQAHKANKAGNKITRNANIASGTSTLAGAGIGAAIGSVILPGIGTLIGAGIGTAVGWFAGDKIAKKIEASRYESEEMQKAIKDSNTTAEELAETFARAKWENATEHFGKIKLSLSEIERIADQIVWGDDMTYFEKFSSATQGAESSLKSLKKASDQMDRWMWKASLGVKFNEDEIESIKQSFDDYISSAKSFVENKHYEFTAAVSLLVDVDSKAGKSVIESGNAFYGKMKSQLDSLGTKLSQKVDIALKDGVITLNEQKEIINLQQQIATITTKIANAEQKAELDLIKVKFGKGNLDYESFENFMAQMQTTIDERMTANDEAFVASVSSLNLQLAEGVISKAEYDKQLQTIVDGYKGTVNTLQAEVKDVELNIIGNAYAKELGNDAAADLERALQYAINEGIDPIDISDEKLAELLNVEKLSGETASNIKDMLSGVLGHVELLEVDGNLMLKIGKVETDGNVEEKVKDELPETVEKTVGVDISGEKNVQTTIDILSEDFGIPNEHAATVALLLTGDKELLNQIDVSKLAKEFGIPESQAKTVIEKLTGEKSIENRLTVLSSDFGIPDSISKTISVNLKAIKGKITNAIGNINLSGSTRFDSVGPKKYRGGYIGGDSAMEAFARGGPTNDGIVGGSTRWIRVNEEEPEMIIPLSSQRRDRALDLWEKTGHLLDVPGFARGGITTGNQDEGIRFHEFRSESAGGGQTVTVDVGGITIELKIEAADKNGVAQAIKDQISEIAESVAEIFADSFETVFENTPVRGGA